MSEPNQHESEQRFEQFLGNLLRVGVVLASTVVLIGGIIYLIRHGSEIPNYKVFDKGPADRRNPVGILENTIHLSGRGVIQFGLLLLIGTPVARVVFSVVGFLRERDFVYVGLTLIVLTVLLFSLFFPDSF